MAKEKKKSTFWSDFKKFISKGNVVDMAVGVVIGGAFGKIVTGLVNYIINPVVSLITGSGKDLDSLKTVLVPEKIVNEVVEQKEIAILWGTWIQTIIDFLIVAFCIFLVLRLITQARATLERKKLAAEEAPGHGREVQPAHGGEDERPAKPPRQPQSQLQDRIRSKRAFSTRKSCSKRSARLYPKINCIKTSGAISSGYFYISR